MNAPQAFQLPPEAIGPYLKLPFSLAAKKTGWGGWELSQEEVEALTPLADAVIKQYLPMINSPHAALILFAGSLAGLTVTKWVMWSDHQKQAKRPPSEVAA